jgi:8-oxoguanine DNA glycosylase, N-terminal domain
MPQPLDLDIQYNLRRPHMANLLVSEWRKLPVSLAELCIDTTLRCGQSFRWKKLRDNEWYAEDAQVLKKRG